MGCLPDGIQTNTGFADELRITRVSIEDGGEARIDLRAIQILEKIAVIFEPFLGRLKQTLRIRIEAGDVFFEDNGITPEDANDGTDFIDFLDVFEIEFVSGHRGDDHQHQDADGVIGNFGQYLVDREIRVIEVGREKRCGIAPIDRFCPCSDDVMDELMAAEFGFIFFGGDDRIGEFVEGIHRFLA